MLRPVIHRYFNEKLLIFFVITPNHAMSNHDNDLALWKCEYLPWEEDCAAMLGNMSKEQIESGASKLTNLMTEIKCRRDELIKYDKQRREGLSYSGDLCD
mgnify:CR=1 FL=1|jgi:hypothetical protein